ncbi:MAG: S8 family serine peptidase [Catalinimonas sp.]
MSYVIRITTTLLLSIGACIPTAFAQSPALKSRLLKASERRHRQVDSLVHYHNLPRLIEEGDQMMALVGLSPANHPLYLATDNLGAAVTSGTHLVRPGGGYNLALTGAGVAVAEWDGGNARNTHQEYGGRVIDGDEGDVSRHATHVAGTIAAAGVVPEATGMAPGANLVVYDWFNDNFEMAAAAAEGLLLSNHSYGIVTGWRYNSEETRYYWYGDPDISQTEDYGFGFYNTDAQVWDEIAHTFPNYLILKSAGNDRNDAGPGAGASHFVWAGGEWVSSTTTRDADGGPDGYDCISYAGTAKNILTVGAVRGILDGYDSPEDVRMSSFSGWGPTDDGRIKPDLVAKGVSVYSSVSSADNAYAFFNGTSMATPTVTGSLTLLQEHYANLNDSTPAPAALLKGLVLHTTDEAGPAPGPDYQNGWGLLNTARAAHLISEPRRGNVLTEEVLADGGVFETNVASDGTLPLRVTICWTDLPGTPAAPSLNPTDLMLVNDLDVRLVDALGDTSQPYVLNPASPDLAATTGDNFRDNVEQIYLAAPAAGTYTVRVTHKGTLEGGVQRFALIVSGLEGTIAPPVIYCTSGAESDADSRIDRVQLANIDTVTADGCATYRDLTSLTAEVFAGETYELEVDLGTCSESYARRLAVYVDWNQDGTFNDTDERLVYTDPAGDDDGTPTFTVSETIDIPAGATPGMTTRMRIVCSEGDQITGCGAYEWGETQDYQLTVINTRAIRAVTLLDDELCQGGAGRVVFEADDNFGGGNEFRLLLSDAAGSFDDAVLLTTLAGTLDDTLSFTLPATLPAGSYYVRVDATEPAIAGDTSDRTLLVWAIPEALVTDGSTTFCEGEEIELTAVAVDGATYSWSGPNGFAATGRTIGRPATAAHAGTYVLTVERNGCESAPEEVEVEVNDLPEVAITTSAPASICVGTSQTLTTPLGEGYAYEWRIVREGADDEIIVGQDILLDDAEPGLVTVYVTVTNAQGCSASDVTSLEYVSLPNVEVTQNGDTLLATSGLARYEWYHEDTLIAGAVAERYTVRHKGRYSVTGYTEEDCGSNDSLVVDIVLDALKLPAGRVRVYPNPTDGEVRVELSGTYRGEITWELFRITGQTVRTGVRLKRSGRCVIDLDLSGQPAGVYGVRMRDTTGGTWQVVERIVRQ